MNAVEYRVADRVPTGRERSVTRAVNRQVQLVPAYSDSRFNSIFIVIQK